MSYFNTVFQYKGERNSYYEGDTVTINTAEGTATIVTPCKDGNMFEHFFKSEYLTACFNRVDVYASRPDVDFGENPNPDKEGFAAVNCEANDGDVEQFEALLIVSRSDKKNHRRVRISRYDIHGNILERVV